MWQFIFAVLLGGISLFLILLILVQRGRGGGLTGALGGMGGQSAFGTKAGDAFTKVTVISATIWIITAVIAVKFLGTKDTLLGDPDKATPTVTTTSGDGTDAEDFLKQLQQSAGDTDAETLPGTTDTPAAETTPAETTPAGE